MKAKEYAAMYKAALETETQEKAVMTMFIALVKELPVICEQRKTKSNSAVIAVAEELNQKWKAICAELPGELNPDGFETWLRIDLPDLWQSIESTRKLIINRRNRVR